MNPLVSIVTPSYNKGCFLEETILSVKHQTYPHVEHIVVDGGSTDETLDILRKYDDTITWISEPDEGQSDAINKGLRMSRGQIVAYLNADDTYLPFAAETAVEFFGQHPKTGMFYGDCEMIDASGGFIRKYPAGEFELRRILSGPCYVPQPSAFLQRWVLDEVGYFDPTLHIGMDLDLWIRIGMKFDIGYVPRVLSRFRFYPGSKSFSETDKNWKERFAILDKAFSSPDLPKETAAIRKQAYSYAHYAMGVDYYLQRHLSEARHHLIMSVRLSPRRIKEPETILFILTSYLGKTLVETASRLRSRLKNNSRP